MNDRVKLIPLRKIPGVILYSGLGIPGSPPHPTSSSNVIPTGTDRGPKHGIYTDPSIPVNQEITGPVSGHCTTYQSVPTSLGTKIEDEGDPRPEWRV